ncbi:CC171 protein, partial [Polyodon spathula]|nr:CC171 protein [Polyodon spathula]
QEDTFMDVHKKLTELAMERNKDAVALRRQTSELEYSAECQERSKKDLELTLQRVKNVDETTMLERAAHLESKFNSEIIQFLICDLEAALQVEQSSQAEAVSSFEMIKEQSREVEKAYKQEKEKTQQSIEKLQREAHTLSGAHFHSHLHTDKQANQLILTVSERSGRSSRALSYRGPSVCCALSPSHYITSKVITYWYIINQVLGSASPSKRKPVNARLLRARFNGKHCKLTIIQCYSPTNNAEPEEKETFHDTLQAEKEKVPEHDVLMGDLNAKVGSDNTGRERIMSFALPHMGTQVCGTMNENGEKLCYFCGMNRMVIGGTIFEHKNIHNLTWISPNIMINSKWRRSLLDVCVKRGAGNSSDHHLLQATIKLKLRKIGSCKQTRQEHFNLHFLRDITQATAVTVKVKNKFKILAKKAVASEQIHKKWNNIKNVYNQISKEILGIKTRHHKDWISAATWENIQENILKTK